MTSDIITHGRATFVYVQQNGRTVRRALQDQNGKALSRADVTVDNMLYEALSGNHKGATLHATTNGPALNPNQKMNTFGTATRLEVRNAPVHPVTVPSSSYAVVSAALTVYDAAKSTPYMIYSVGKSVPSVALNALKATPGAIRHPQQWLRSMENPTTSVIHNVTISLAAVAAAINASTEAFKSSGVAVKFIESLTGPQCAGGVMVVTAVMAGATVLSACVLGMDIVSDVCPNALVSLWGNSGIFNNSTLITFLGIFANLTNSTVGNSNA
jgi:hypothetical protein